MNAKITAIGNYLFYLHDKGNKNKIVWKRTLKALTFAVLFSLFSIPVQAKSLRVQVLGSGGPELTDKRSSTSYLIWLEGKAELLIDTGPGSSYHFEQSGAKFNDIKAILYTHLHVDHSSDLPAYIKGGFFTNRTNNLLVYGPKGNKWLPSTTLFVQKLFGNDGLYPYLNEYINPKETSRYKIQTSDVQPKNSAFEIIYLPDKIKATATTIHHGPISALAWRLDFDGCSVTFSGDTNNQLHTLERLAKDTNLLIAHHAISDSSDSVANKLHMTPFEIGTIAGKAKVKKLVLSHRMQRTSGVEQDTLKAIRQSYVNKVDFADDMSFYDSCSN